MRDSNTENIEEQEQDKPLSGKQPIVIDIQLDDPQPHKNNVYEIVGALPHNLNQVFQGEIPAKEITIFCSKRARVNIKIGADHPAVKYRYYEEMAFWPEEKTAIGLFTTPLVFFDDIRQDNLHIHNNLTVFSFHDDCKDLLGNQLKSYCFNFQNPVLDKKLKAKRERVLVEAIIWYKNLRRDQILINPKDSFMRLFTTLELYPYLRMNPDTGKYEIQEEALEDLRSIEDTIIQVRRR